jgi:hypothetical protein
MLRTCLKKISQNFILMKVKELLAQKCHEDCYNFCSGVNCMYNMGTEYLNKRTKPIVDLAFYVDDT